MRSNNLRERTRVHITLLSRAHKKSRLVMLDADGIWPTALLLPHSHRVFNIEIEPAFAMGVYRR